MNKLNFASVMIMVLGTAAAQAGVGTIGSASLKCEVVAEGVKVISDAVVCSGPSLEGLQAPNVQALQMKLEKIARDEEIMIDTLSGRCGVIGSSLIFRANGSVYKVLSNGFRRESEKHGPAAQTIVRTIRIEDAAKKIIVESNIDEDFGGRLNVTMHLSGAQQGTISCEEKSE